MNLKTTIILFLITIVGFFTLGYFWPRDKPRIAQPSKQYWENKDFKPKIDTSNQEYSLTPIKQNDLKAIEPWKITIHPDPAPTTSNGFKVINQDSIFQIVDSLNKIISQLSNTFLTSYPKASKLIGGIFTGDSLRFDLLQPNGSIIKATYLTNYLEYDYYYSSPKGMSVIAHSKPISSISNVNHSINANLGYLTVISSSSIGLDYRFAYKRYNLQTSLDYFITPNLPSIQAKIGYKIY